MTLSAVERLVLHAMARVQEEGGSKKSVVVLRRALRDAGRWHESLEDALCNAGDEHPLVAEFYTALRRLIHETQYAEGAGNLRLPAGPRYTECWITEAGLLESSRNSIAS
jgi:hypothetical protein